MLSFIGKENSNFHRIYSKAPTATSPPGFYPIDFAVADPEDAITHINHL